MDYNKTDELGKCYVGKVSPSDIPMEIRDKNYIHLQVAPADTWIVKHPLRKRPSVQVLDEQGNVVITRIESIDDETVIVYFNEPCCGSVICN